MGKRTSSAQRFNEAQKQFEAAMAAESPGPADLRPVDTATLTIGGYEASVPVVEESPQIQILSEAIQTVPATQPALPALPSPVAPQISNVMVRAAELYGDVQPPVIVPIATAAPVPVVTEALPEFAQHYLEATQIGGDFERYWAPIAGKAILLWVSKYKPDVVPLRESLRAVLVRPLVDTFRGVVRGVAAFPMRARFKDRTWKLESVNKVLYTTPPKTDPALWPELPQRVYTEMLSGLELLRDEQAFLAKKVVTYDLPCVYAAVSELPAEDDYSAEFTNKWGPWQTAEQRARHYLAVRQAGTTEYLVPYRWTSGGRPCALLTHPATVVEAGNKEFKGFTALDRYGMKISVTV